MASARGSCKAHKIIVVGQSGSGKTSLIKVYFYGGKPDTYATTICIDINTKNITVNGKPMTLQIWDTAGQERFSALTSSYYKGADAVIICISVTDKNVIKNTREMISEVNKYAPQDCIRIIAITQTDNEAKRVNENAVLIDLAKKLGIPHILTSAYDLKSVNTLFATIAAKLSNKIKDDKVASKPIKLAAEKSEQSSGCCW